MSVRLYQARQVLLATIWTGKKSDLSDFPDLPEYTIDSKGNIILHGIKDGIAQPNKHYILRGVTGLYFVCDVEQFLANYYEVDADNVAFEVGMQGQVIFSLIT